MQEDDNQIENHLTQVDTLLDSPLFSADSSDDGPWKPEFSQLITLIHSLLLQADQAGKRVSFLEGVGVNGKIQDVTSLVNWMYDRLPELSADKPGQQSDNRLNRYTDQGWGYFANGSFFTVEFDDELGFFIDDQRIYLNHHIRRALAEVKQTFPTRFRSAL